MTGVWGGIGRVTEVVLASPRRRITVLSACCMAMLASCGAAGSTTIGIDAADEVSALAVEGGRRHACAIGLDRTVSCWGANSFGQLGDGNPFVQEVRPRKVAEVHDVVDLALGSDFSCAIDSSGGGWCWGQNVSGQIGDGAELTLNLVPSRLPPDFAATQISAGYFHVCARTASGSAMCWGDGALGQLGTGSWTNRSLPTPVAGLGTGVEAVAGGGHHSCAVRSGGDVWCWGLNASGQLGDGTRRDRAVPTRVEGLPPVRSLALGGDFTCALDEGSQVWCWGANQFGQLGDGTTRDRATPAVVSGSSGIVELVVAERHACARTEAGEVACWGGNESGQLGDGTTVDRTRSVAAPVGPSISLALTDVQSCALTGEGLTCWNP